jgi:hypothetical protein
MTDRDERDIEAPEADLAGQAELADPDDLTGEPAEVHVGADVTEYDAIEQARIVDLSDDY